MWAKRPRGQLDKCDDARKCADAESHEWERRYREVVADRRELFRIMAAH